MSASSKPKPTESIRNVSRAIISESTTFHFKPLSTLCSVLYNNKSGTGALCRLEFPKGTWHNLLISSFQVLKITSISKVIGVQLIFQNEKINLTPDWVKKLWTSSADEMDLTIIELSLIARSFLSTYNIEYLVSAYPQKAEIVTIYQISTNYKNTELIQVNGNIDDIIDGKVIEINGIIELIDAGSLVLNGDYKVIGIIPSASCRGKNISRHNKIEAINIVSIFDEFIRKLNIRFDKHTQNKEWVEWIYSIPQNELYIIGTGAFGNVYKTTEPNGNFIALKQVGGFGKLDSYKIEAQALEKEYLIVISLIHPRIIQFFAFVNDDQQNKMMIAMEYLEGGSLDDKIKPHKPLDNDSSCKYLMQILEGLDFLHNKKIFHSDIKPKNILFTSDDNIKIADFGIAVIDHTNSTPTASHCKGTRFFICPERLNGEPRSAENDIWCAGAVFVTMMTGHTLNHNVPAPEEKISQYKIYILGVFINEFLQNFHSEDFRKIIISRTLCKEKYRASTTELLKICQHRTFQTRMSAINNFKKWVSLEQFGYEFKGNAF